MTAGAYATKDENPFQPAAHGVPAPRRPQRLPKGGLPRQ